MTDDSIIRDARGRIVKGSPGLHRKQEQPAQDNPTPIPDVSDTSFDDDLIAAAESFGQPRSKIGRRAWCENLRDTRPIEFAALLSKALARRDEAAISATGGPGVIVNFTTAPTGWCVDAEGKLIEPEAAKATWEGRSGMQLTGEPPQSTPSKPVLIHPRAGPELTANEIEFGGVDDDDDEPPQSA